MSRPITRVAHLIRLCLLAAAATALLAGPANAFNYGDFVHSTAFSRADADYGACTLEGNTLYIDYEDTFGDQTVALTSAHWSRDGETYRAAGLNELASANGVPIPMPIPDGEIIVQCGAGFSIQINGAVGGDIIQDAADTYLNGQNLDIQTVGLALEAGFAWGRDIIDRKVPGPINPDVRYFYFYFAQKDVAVTLGSVSVQGPVGDQYVVVLVDPSDPAFYVGFHSDALADATNAIAGGGVGVSAHGELTWSSALPLWDDRGEARVRHAYGHAYMDAKIGLIPIPRFPINIWLDGEFLLGFGGLLDAQREALTAQMVAARTSSDALFEMIGNIATEMTLAANLRSVSISIDQMEIEVGRASLLLENGLLMFAGCRGIGCGSDTGAMLMDVGDGPSTSEKMDEARLLINAASTFEINQEINGFVDMTSLSTAPRFGVRFRASVVVAGCQLPSAWFQLTQDGLDIDHNIGQVTECWDRWKDMIIGATCDAIGDGFDQCLNVVNAGCIAAQETTACKELLKSCDIVANIRTAEDLFRDGGHVFICAAGKACEFGVNHVVPVGCDVTMKYCEASQRFCDQSHRDPAAAATEQTQAGRFSGTPPVRVDANVPQVVWDTDKACALNHADAGDDGPRLAVFDCAPNATPVTIRPQFDFWGHLMVMETTIDGQTCRLTQAPTTGTYGAGAFQRAAVFSCDPAVPATGLAINYSHDGDVNITTLDGGTLCILGRGPESEDGALLVWNCPIGVLGAANFDDALAIEPANHTRSSMASTVSAPESAGVHWTPEGGVVEEPMVPRTYCGQLHTADGIYLECARGDGLPHPDLVALCAEQGATPARLDRAGAAALMAVSVHRLPTLMHDPQGGCVVAVEDTYEAVSCDETQIVFACQLAGANAVDISSGANGCTMVTYEDDTRLAACSKPANRWSAKASCLQMGGRLANLSDARSHARASDLAARTPQGNAWIGLTAPKGKFWRWNTANGIKGLQGFDAWAPGQRTRLSASLNRTAFVRDGKWFAARPAQKRAYICEFEAVGAGAATTDDGLGHAVAVGDFDDDGVQERVVSAPNDRTLNGRSGGVYVYDADGNTLAYLHDGRQTDGAMFGTALAVGDFNGDQVDDLVVGAPGLNQVFVFYGAIGGLSMDNRRVIDGFPLEGFGASLAVGDRDMQVDSLAIGAPLTAGTYVGTPTGAVMVCGGYRTGTGVGMYAGDFDAACWARVTRSEDTAAKMSGFGTAVALVNIDGVYEDELVVGGQGGVVLKLADSSLWGEVFADGDPLNQGEMFFPLEDATVDSLAFRDAPPAVYADGETRVGATIYAGQPGADLVHALEFSNTDWTQAGAPPVRHWTRTHIFSGEAGDRFGTSLAILWNTIVVGAPGALGGAGQVTRYRANGTQALRLDGADLDPSAGLGASVVTFREGGKPAYLVGAPGALEDGRSAGRAAVFHTVSPGVHDLIEALGQL